ncbi:MAG: carbon storage regulator [Planctomycetaceae bacterium]|nr:carbon storage regulator [Planctomycetaceae bacterium]
MLVLSRRPSEELLIDGNIRVVVLAVQGQRVRLGISAPDDVSIHRAEIELQFAQDLVLDVEDECDVRHCMTA